MELTEALAFAGDHKQAVLVTMRANGLPQLSNVLYACSDDGLIRISITADRAKYANLLRRGWAALHVTRPDFFAYAVLEGDVTLSAVAGDPHDATVEELVEHYRDAVGEHPNWDDFRATMVKDRRVVVRLRPTRAYGML
jgi:PPOX class probable F420-dependent enzyme